MISRNGWVFHEVKDTHGAVFAFGILFGLLEITCSEGYLYEI